MRVALYARVSTKDQNPDAQLQALREYAARRGTEALEYVDHGISGARDRRPALDELMQAARRRGSTRWTWQPPKCRPGSVRSRL